MDIYKLFPELSNTCEFHGEERELCPIWLLSAPNFVYGANAQ